MLMMSKKMDHTIVTFVNLPLNRILAYLRTYGDMPILRGVHVTYVVEWKDL